MEGKTEALTEEQELLEQEENERGGEPDLGGLSMKDHLVASDDGDPDAAEEEQTDTMKKAISIAPPREQMVRSKVSLNMSIAHRHTDGYGRQGIDGIHGHAMRLDLVFVGPVRNGMYVDPVFVREKAMVITDQWDNSLVVSMSEEPRYIRVLAQHNRRVNVVPFNPTLDMLSMQFFRLAKSIFEKDLQCVTLSDGEIEVTYPI